MTYEYEYTRNFCSFGHLHVTAAPFDLSFCVLKAVRQQVPPGKSLVLVRNIFLSKSFFVAHAAVDYQKDGNMESQ